MKNLNLSFSLFWLAAFVLLVCGVLVPGTIGFLRGDYSWTANYISELGVNGAEYAQFINLFGFLPVAISSAVAIFCLRARLSGLGLAQMGFVLLCFGLSGGYLSAVFFPCDFGCPVEGSFRQMIHNLSGMLAYPLGTLGLILLAVGLDQKATYGLRATIFIVAALTALGFGMMINPEQATLRGFWQRLADFAMFALVVYLGYVLPTHKR